MIQRKNSQTIEFVNSERQICKGPLYRNLVWRAVVYQNEDDTVTGATVGNFYCGDNNSVVARRNKKRKCSVIYFIVAHAARNFLKK